MRRSLLVAFAFALLAASAHGATPRPFGKLDCVPRDGLRHCAGGIGKTVPSFDGVPLDADVTLPATGDGPFPLMIIFHGYSGEKRNFNDELPRHEGPKGFARRGYAVLHATARGFHGSCGDLDARLAEPAACARGWLHLDDLRYEIRDAQHLAGLLADEGLIEPKRIGAWADSYGGAPSLALAILRDRVMLGGLDGEADGTFAPWRSPRGKALELRAAAPYQTWSDLAGALTPNGRGLDYTVPTPTESFDPPGVLKASFVAGLFATGQIGVPAGDPHGYYAPPGVDPGADLTSWVSRLYAGEPYAGDPLVEGLAEELRRFHATIALDTGARGPAPMFLGSGTTDDLFPPLEMLRIRNRLQALHPASAIALWLGDFGHQRGQEKLADVRARNDRIYAWMDHYVRGIGPVPFGGIEALTHTCGGPSEGPYRADTWAASHPGEVRATLAGPATVVSAAGSLAVGQAIDPVVAGNNPCGTTSAADQGGGGVTLRLPKVAAPGYTLLGSPTVIARLDATGSYPQITGRLWDVAPDGSQLLVARGVLRPRSAGAREPFQLAATAYRFAPGHIPKLELVGNDAPFLRPSNGAFSIDVSELELRLPVRERPAAARGVAAPSPELLPPGATQAPDLPPRARAARSRAARVSVRVTGTGCRTRFVRVRATGRTARRLDVRVGRRRVGRDVRRPLAVRLRRPRRATTLRMTVRRVDGSERRFVRRLRACN